MVYIFEKILKKYLKMKYIFNKIYKLYNKFLYFKLVWTLIKNQLILRLNKNETRKNSQIKY